MRTRERERATERERSISFTRTVLSPDRFGAKNTTEPLDVIPQTIPVRDATDKRQALPGRSPRVGSAVSVPLHLLHRNVQRFRGGLVCKAHRLLYHSTLGLRVIQKKQCRQISINSTGY